VGSKRNQQWLSIVIEKETRLVVAAYIGDRDKESAKRLWSRLPEAWRTDGKFYTDYWKSYAQIIPENQHEAVDKKTGETSLIERLIIL
jgi:insertion element IS1 protein InsB